jgi:hypothetical protein
MFCARTLLARHEKMLRDSQATGRFYEYRVAINDVAAQSTPIVYTI